MRPSTSRLSLLGRFSLMSLAVIATLGLAIGLTLKRQIEQRALARASQLAEVVAERGVTRMKVFHDAAHIVYADDHGLIGDDERDEPGVREALRGGRTADLQRG